MITIFLEDPFLKQSNITVLLNNLCMVCMCRATIHKPVKEREAWLCTFPLLPKLSVLGSTATTVAQNSRPTL